MGYALSENGHPDLLTMVLLSMIVIIDLVGINYLFS